PAVDFGSFTPIAVRTPTDGGFGRALAVFRVAVFPVLDFTVPGFTLSREVGFAATALPEEFGSDSRTLDFAAPLSVAFFAEPLCPGVVFSSLEVFFSPSGDFSLDGAFSFDGLFSVEPFFSSLEVFFSAPADFSLDGAFSLDGLLSAEPFF